MANKKYIFQPNYAIHPGEYLDELLDARDMSQAELAIRLGISKKHISNIINGKASVTVDIAHALEKVFSDYTAKYWLSIQNTYDLFQQQEKTEQQYSAAQEETIIWLEQFDYAYLVKAGYVKETAAGTDAGAKARNLLSFFGCVDISSWNTLYCSDLPAACRITGAATAKIGNTSAWIRAGQISASPIVSILPSYSKEKFREALKSIRKLTVAPPDDLGEKMQMLCREAGVELLFVREIPKSGICGAAYWINDTPCIQMSLRYKKNDHFWFTFFHEAAHILCEHKKMVFLDCDQIEDTDMEKEADRISRDFLIPPTAYRAFVRSHRFYDADICRFAAQIDIHPGIVVGRLQHDKLIQWNWHNGLKDTFSWAERE